jgi:hypothetical protein
MTSFLGFSSELRLPDEKYTVIITVFIQHQQLKDNK